MKFIFFLALKIILFSHLSFCDYQNAYEGYWRFVKKDFKKRHRFLPSFLIEKAIQTRLYISSTEFIQYISPDVIHKEPRKITDISKIENGWKFTRIEDKKEINFKLVKEKNNWFFKEVGKEYQVIKDNQIDVEKWKGKNKY